MNVVSIPPGSRLRCDAVELLDSCTRTFVTRMGCSVKSLIAVIGLSSLVSLVACAPRNSTNATPDQTLLDRAPKQTNDLHAVDPKDLTQYDLADHLAFELKESCAESVCGALPTFDANLDAQAQAATEAQMVNWKARIQQLALQEQLATKAEADTYRAQKAILKAAVLDRNSIALLNYVWAMSKRSSISSAVDWTNYKIDDAKWTALFPMNTEDSKNLKTMLNRFYGFPEIRAGHEMYELGLDMYFKRLSPTQDAATLQTTVQTYAKGIRAQIETLARQFPSMSHLRASQATIDLSEGRTIDVTAQEQFIEDVRGAAIAHVTGDALSDFSLAKPDIGPNVDLFFNSTLTKLELTVAQKVEQAKIDRSIRRCRADLLFIHRHRGQQASIMQSTSAMIESVRTQAKSVATALATVDADRQSAASAIDNAQIILPDSLDEYRKKIESDFDRQLTYQSRRINDVKTLTPQDLLLMIVDNNLSIESSEDSLDYFGNCDDHDPSEVSDHSELDLGSIRLTWTTLLRDSSSAGILAHEMGHLVSKALSKSNTNRYTSAYACVTTRSLDRTASQTQEEDFADLFSTRVLSRMESQRAKNGNPMCALLTTDSAKRYGYDQGLSMIWPAAKETKAVHSTSLARLIQIELDRGHSLSPSCGQILSQARPAMTYRCD